MNFKRFIPALILACAAAALIVHRVSTSRSNDSPFRTSFLVFNTQATVTIFDDEHEKAAEACRDLIGKLTELHLTINAFDEASELSRLNATAAEQPFRCSPLLWDIILKSEEAWKLSNGLFDVTVGPLLALWGFHAKQDRLPTQQDIDAVLKLIGFDKLILDKNAHTLQFPCNGMRLDFGGIAKGYALQLAMDVLNAHNRQSYLIDLGGNIYRTDTPEGDIIGITNPIDKTKLLGTVKLHGQCIATSGNYERFRIIQCKRIAHIMDPRTGWPVTLDDDARSVTAITRDPTFSDVFSTTAFVGGEDTARKLTRQFSGTAFVFATPAKTTAAESAKTPAAESANLTISIVGECDFQPESF